MDGERKAPRWKIRKGGSTRFFLLALCLLFAWACDLHQPPGKEPALIVGERRVPLEELRAEMRYLSPASAATSDAGARERILQRVIDRYLMLEFAREKNLRVEPEEVKRTLAEMLKGYSERAYQEALIRESVNPEELERRIGQSLLLDRVMDFVRQEVTPPSSQEIKKFYEENEDRFRTPKSLRFRQIFTRDEKKAKELALRLAEGEDFGTLARDHSEGPEAARDGEVGWVSEGQLEAAMEKALFSQEPGGPGGVVRTPYGFHIFEVLEKRPARIIPLPEVLGQVERELFDKKCGEYLRTWLNGLRKRYRVTLRRGALSSLELS